MRRPVVLFAICVLGLSTTSAYSVEYIDLEGDQADGIRFGGIDPAPVCTDPSHDVVHSRVLLDEAHVRMSVTFGDAGIEGVRCYGIDVPIPKREQRIFNLYTEDYFEDGFYLAWIFDPPTGGLRVSVYNPQTGLSGTLDEDETWSGNTVTMEVPQAGFAPTSGGSFWYELRPPFRYYGSTEVSYAGNLLTDDFGQTSSA